ncbi:PREDICTED: serine/arginine repetitive matrix protein 1-like [Elephantulus edwardii]|uniref:serine/arginine repetitive matrix protein 1-like n=1 Tax=Elephantulus edwardii TaxID=28737 RepID=UPI0003F07B7C|nr:PREDICTED: serine/arginine repetitive matrix protein 1-like [Elephantulus edwardii]
MAERKGERTAEALSQRRPSPASGRPCSGCRWANLRHPRATRVRSHPSPTAAAGPGVAHLPRCPRPPCPVTAAFSDLAEPGSNAARSPDPRPGRKEEEGRRSRVTPPRRVRHSAQARRLARARSATAPSPRPLRRARALCSSAPPLALCPVRTRAMAPPPPSRLAAGSSASRRGGRVLHSSLSSPCTLHAFGSHPKWGDTERRARLLGAPRRPVSSSPAPPSRRRPEGAAPAWHVTVSLAGAGGRASVARSRLPHRAASPHPRPAGHPETSGPPAHVATVLSPNGTAPAPSPLRS